MMIAATYHAYAKMDGIDASAAMCMNSTMDLRRHCVDGESEGLCNMSGSFMTLLDTYGDSEIILCTLPAAFFLEGQTEGTTNHDIQPLIVEEIAQITREVAAERGYTLIDIHALTAQHPEWFSKDGVHPSNEGAAAIAQEVYSVIRSK